MLKLVKRTIEQLTFHSLPSIETKKKKHLRATLLAIVVYSCIVSIADTVLLHAWLSSRDAKPRRRRHFRLIKRICRAIKGENARAATTSRPKVS